MKYCIVIFLTILLFCACEEDIVKPTINEFAPSITEIKAPSLVSPGEEYKIEVEVMDPQGVKNLLFVLLSYYKETTQLSTIDTLWDDGGALNQNDGDVLALDGVFSQNIQWQHAGDELNPYSLVFRAYDRDGNESDTAGVVVTAIEKNNPPEILDFFISDTLKSGFIGEEIWWVQVVDSQGLENIQSVVFEGYQQSNKIFEGNFLDDGSSGDVTSGDGIFSIAVDAGFAASKIGSYEMHIYATDLLGKSSQTETQDLFIENAPPEISNLTIADSTQRPTQDITYIPITLEVSDAQTLVDISRVGFESLKPDGTSPSVPFFDMVDDGETYDDAVAGDGIYSIVIQLDPSAQLGEYTFTFRAEDKAGNISNVIEKKFKVY